MNAQSASERKDHCKGGVIEPTFEFADVDRGRIRALGQFLLRKASLQSEAPQYRAEAGPDIHPTTAKP